MESLEGWQIAVIATKAVVYASALLAAGGAWFLASQPALPDVARRQTIRIALVAALVGAAATLLQLGVRAGQMIDDGWGGMIDPDMLALATESPLGMSSWIRLTGLALVLTLPLFGGHLPWLAIVGALLVAVSFALTGHVTREPRLALSVLLTAHVAVASFWVGALWPLHRLAADDAALREAGQASERFGRTASWAVTLLLAVGIGLAWLLAGSWGVLFGTPYGWTLLVKVALVGALLLLAAANKWRLAPALCGTDPRSAARAASGLCRSIQLEAVLFVAILIATAILTSATELPD